MTEFQKIFEQLEKIGGWMGPGDCEVLFNYTKDLQDSLIVEIGSYLGRSTTLMALASPSSQIIAIDPYIDQEEIKKEFCKNMKKFNVSLINSTSRDASVDWNRKIDFLHIDGNHHYVKVIEDIVRFVPHVKKGGYVLLHDYAVNEERSIEGNILENPDYGVIRAVELLKGAFFSEVKIESGFACCKK